MDVSCTIFRDINAKLKSGSLPYRTFVSRPCSLDPLEFLDETFPTKLEGWDYCTVKIYCRVLKIAVAAIELAYWAKSLGDK